MNVIDVAVVLLILCAGVVGLKRGVFKELVMTVGLLIVYILAFKLKDPIANWLSINLPFFNFGGDFYGATALNILLYQAIAFIIMFALLMVVFNVIYKIVVALVVLFGATTIRLNQKKKSLVTYAMYFILLFGIHLVWGYISTFGEFNLQDIALETIERTALLMLSMFVLNVFYSMIEKRIKAKIISK